MPINKTESVSLGFTAPIAVSETIEDLSARIGISKAQFIKKSVMEMIYKLLKIV